MDKREIAYWENTKTIFDIFQNLGFVVHPQPKSSFYSTQQIEFLGFEMNSVSMTITLTNAKKENLNLFCTNILNSGTPKIRTVARLLGKITSTFPAAKFDRQHYRGLEKCKAITLCKSNGNFNARTNLTEAVKSDIRLWKENVNHLFNDIIVPNPNKCITTDVSSYGLGAVMESNSTGGLFSTSEMKEHINVLELKAILFGLKALAKGLTKIQIKVLTDNSTEVACINKFGKSRLQKCDSVTKYKCQWVSESSVWLSATHLPGTQNTEAGFDLENMKYTLNGN